MSRLQTLLRECLGPALCEKGRQALTGHWTYPEVLPEVARVAFEKSHKCLPGGTLTSALQEAAQADPGEYETLLTKLPGSLAMVYPVAGYQESLVDYLRALPAAVRAVLRRPSDPSGRTAPDKMVLYKPEDLLVFLPARKPRFRRGARPANLDDWTLTELRGMGGCSEVWEAEDPARPHARAALKFVTDPDAATRVLGGAPVFEKVFRLKDQRGCLPLRSVYLESDPPCLESPFVPGYDLTGLMFDWRWKYDAAKPDAALKLVRRLAATVAKAHEAGVVHRGLKPSNVLLHPTEGGKFVAWLTDFGWGALEATREIEVEKALPKAEQERLARRGAATRLYASPQVLAGSPANPLDDVYAIGVIWYQLLRRDPAAPAPAGTEWVEELRPAGLTDSMAKALRACLSPKWEDRPRNAMLLADLLEKVTVAGPPNSPDDSKFVRPAALGGAGKGGGPSSRTLPKLVKNSIGITFVRVPGGAFRMGSPEGETGRRPGEGPDREVRLTRGFYLGVTPVTQGQYARVMDRNPSKFKPGPGGGSPEHPVESVKWDDAVQFCEALGRVPAEMEAGRTYRLPTEAEWEYACRAGTTTPFHFGPKMTGKDGVFATAGGSKYCGKSTAPVTQFPPNAWGLYDLHGNVQEWCADWYDAEYYETGPAIDPPGPDVGTARVVRGGCWSAFANDCRSAARRGQDPDKPADTIGFRIIMEEG